MLQNGLNVAVFALATAVGVEYRVAAVLAGLVALVASFLLNRQSTFTSRPVEEAALDAHSLPLETAVELGLVGLLALSLLVAGAGWRRGGHCASGTCSPAPRGPRAHGCCTPRSTGTGRCPP